MHRAENAFILVLILLCVSAGCARHQKNLSSRAPLPPSQTALHAKVGSSETGIASWYGDPYHGRQSASGEIFDKEKLTAAHRTLPFQTWVEVTNLENGKRVTVRINDRGPFVAGRIIDLSQAAGREIDLVRMGIARVRLEVIEPGGYAAPLTTPSVTTSSSTRPSIPPPPMTPPSITSPSSSSPSSTTAVPSPPPPLPPMDTFALSPTRDPSNTAFSVQAASFFERERAELLSARMAQRFGDSRVVTSAFNQAGNQPGSFWQVLVGRQLTQDQASALAVLVSEVMRAAGAGPASVVIEPF